jgi:hypothetical protein
LKNFMSQLFANANDTGRGRNMPVHYGQNYPRTVSATTSLLQHCTLPNLTNTTAHNFIPISHTDPPSRRSSLRTETPRPSKPKPGPTHCGLLLRRRSRQRR